MKLNRREFLKTTGASVGASFAAPLIAQAAAEGDQHQVANIPIETKRGDMIYRTLGGTGETVSLIGMGGYHIGKIPQEDEGIRLVRAGIDRGITFMDNCWDYNKGESELRMGKALRDGYRNKVFLMTKIDGRTKDAAARQIDESLTRLQTDHLDLLQHHEILRMEDPDQVFAAEGSMAAALEAQKAGKVRYIGFTGHKDPLVHLRMLEVAQSNNFHFDTLQMPLNVMDAHFRSFRSQVLPVALEQGIGVLAMKTMGDKFVLKSDTAHPIECLHYAMNLPVSVVITGIDSPAILDQAFEAVRTFRPFQKGELATLLSRTREAATRGEFEPYKTSHHFDGTAQNPEWLGYPKESA